MIPTTPEVSGPPAPASCPARRPPRRGVRLARDVAAMLLLFALVGAWQARGHLPAGSPLEASLPTLAGPVQSLRALQGKPVLLALWAPWCTVCKVEAQNLSWVQRLVGERARVISVAAAYTERAEVQAYVREHGVDYPVLLGNDELLRELRVEAFPTVYFLDAAGRVKRSAAGYTTTAGLLWRLLL
jgi:thiol-disulfide isomerase/thioredoxin